MEFDKIELLGLIGSLTTVVLVLWRIHLTNTKKEQERLSNYEELHTKSQEHILELTGEYRELKGRMDGVETLSRSVLDAIKESNK